MVQKSEKWVKDSSRLVYASYSYWTLGYILSLEGAKKLLGNLKEFRSLFRRAKHFFSF